MSPEIGETSIVMEVFTDSDTESEAYRLLNEKEVETKEEEGKIDVPKWIQALPEKEVVLWGCGYYFKQKLSQIEQICKIRYVCDNNPERWGKEILPGIRCISPDELKQKEDVFVVIGLENALIGFDIARQLQGMGIYDYDMLDNWMSYSKYIKWKDSLQGVDKE